MVKHTQTIRRQIADELFECVWTFVKLALKGLDGPRISVTLLSTHQPKMQKKSLGINSHFLDCDFPKISWSVKEIFPGKLNYSIKKGKYCDRILYDYDSIYWQNFPIFYCQNFKKKWTSICILKSSKEMQVGKSIIF